MKQPIKRNTLKKSLKDKERTKNKSYIRKKKNTKKKEYGTSKLERDFAAEYLDKLGLKYIYQYKAKEIGRYYDFAIIYDDGNDLIEEVKDGIRCVKQEGQFFRIQVLIEVDGDWYHSNKRIVNESEMNPMQKHNKRIDEYKNKYAAENSIVLLRIWEYDIRNNKKDVEKKLRDNLTTCEEKIKKQIIKKSRKIKKEIIKKEKDEV
jgi:hypothetical protein